MTGQGLRFENRMNTLVTEQITSFIAMIQHAGIPALRIAFIIAVLAMSGVGLYTFQKRHQFFDQDPEVDTDKAVDSHNPRLKRYFCLRKDDAASALRYASVIT